MKMSNVIARRISLIVVFTFSLFLFSDSFKLYSVNEDQGKRTIKQRGEFEERGDDSRIIETSRVNETTAKAKKENSSGVFENPGIRKKRKFPWLAVVGAVVVVGVAVYLLLKKKKEPKYTLTVNTGEGITGFPVNGTTTHKKGEFIPYSYSRVKGFRAMEVKLDGQPISTSGSIKMDSNHTLTVSAQKLGRITDVTVKFTVKFKARNLKVKHKVDVDGVTKIDEKLKFKAHASDPPVEIIKTFVIKRKLGTINIRHEAKRDYSRFFWECGCIWCTEYYLEISQYNYEGGADPGRPVLSEKTFYLCVAPWRNDPNDTYYRIKTKSITINSPSYFSSKYNSKGKSSKSLPNLQIFDSTDK